MRLIAIDPGANGAIALADQFGALVHKLPEHENEIAQLLNNLCVVSECIAVIERVHAAPRLKPGDDRGVGERVQMGASSAFNFGRSYGFLRGICQLLLVQGRLSRFEDVTPQRWQAHLGLTAGLQGPARKRALKERARQRYPQLKPTLVTCDALLLLDWFISQRRPASATGGGVRADVDQAPSV